MRMDDLDAVVLGTVSGSRREEFAKQNQLEELSDKGVALGAFAEN